MKFDLPQDSQSIIKVIGVGGGGSNAVNHMFRQGIKGVDFVVCNSDQQALDNSPVPAKIQLGLALTQGLGAGSLPEVGKNAAMEALDNVKEALADTKMVFITAGMGGGTGTGAAPVIAAAAKELGILTVGIVTIPFAFEGRKRKNQAQEGLEELRKSVDTLLVINNDKLREMYGNLSLANAFAEADNVLTTAAKGISEVITVSGLINVDFNDVSTVMSNGGTAIMGYAEAEGEDRAIKVVEEALACPLLNENDIHGASQVLLYITSGSKEVTMDEVGEISDYIQEEAGSTANIIFGVGFDEELGEKIRAIVIATGFEGTNTIPGVRQQREKKILSLDEQVTEQSVTVENTPVSKVETKSENSVEEPYLKTKDETPVSEEKSFTLPFETEAPEAATEQDSTEKKVHILDLDDNVTSSNHEEETLKSSADVEREEQEKRARERVMRLKEFSFPKKASSIREMENEPAYIRRNIPLDDVPHSSENNVSRYTLSEGEDKKTEIRPNNSFLHDNVD